MAKSILSQSLENALLEIGEHIQEALCMHFEARSSAVKKECEKVISSAMKKIGKSGHGTPVPEIDIVAENGEMRAEIKGKAFGKTIQPRRRTKPRERPKKRKQIKPRPRKRKQIKPREKRIVGRARAKQMRKIFKDVLRWVQAGRRGEVLGKAFEDEDFDKSDTEIAFAVTNEILNGNTYYSDLVARFVEGAEMEAYEELGVYDTLAEGLQQIIQNAAEQSAFEIARQLGARLQR